MNLKRLSIFHVLLCCVLSQPSLGRRNNRTPINPPDGGEGSTAPDPRVVQPYNVTSEFAPSQTVIRRLNGSNLFSSITENTDTSTTQVCGGLTFQGKDVATCINTPTPVRTTPMTIFYSHPPNQSGARGGNCVGLFDGSGQFVSLGCNKDGNVVDRPITINASATGCNTLRIVMYVQGDPALDVPIASWPPPSSVLAIRDTKWANDSCGGREVARTETEIGAMYFVNKSRNVIAGQITDRTPSGGGCPVTPNNCQAADMAFSLKFPSDNFTIQRSGLPCSDPGAGGYKNLPCY